MFEGNRCERLPGMTDDLNARYSLTIHKEEDSTHCTVFPGLLEVVVMSKPCIITVGLGLNPVSMAIAAMMTH